MYWSQTKHVEKKMSFGASWTSSLMKTGGSGNRIGTVRNRILKNGYQCKEAETAVIRKL